MKVTVNLLNFLPVLPLEDRVNLLILYSKELKIQYSEMVQAIKLCTRLLEQANAEILLKQEAADAEKH